MVKGRVAHAADVAPVATTLAGAFFDDPVWGWVFPDPQRRRAQHTALWSLLLDSALDYEWVFTTPHHEAAALWIPPGRDELTEPHASRLVPLLDDLVGERTGLVLEVFERFEHAHPHHREHYYLSLLGTHPDHRGAGIGMALLAENLRTIDASGAPAYLESTNPANLARYESVGFAVCGSFTLPAGGPTVTTMWREPREVD